MFLEEKDMNLWLYQNVFRLLFVRRLIINTSNFFVYMEQVALKLWLYENVEAVVSMYEDRFDLCTFQSQLIKEPSRDRQTENYSWWKNLTQRKSGPVTSASSYVKIMSISISVKRTKELRALKGWYASSLCPTAISSACMYN